MILAALAICAIVIPATALTSTGLTETGGALIVVSRKADAASTNMATTTAFGNPKCQKFALEVKVTANSSGARVELVGVGRGTSPTSQTF